MLTMNVGSLTLSEGFRIEGEAAYDSAGRIVSDQRTHQMRGDKPDEADGSGHRHRAADAKRDAENHH